MGIEICAIPRLHSALQVPTDYNYPDTGTLIEATITTTTGTLIEPGRRRASGKHFRPQRRKLSMEEENSCLCKGLRGLISRYSSLSTNSPYRREPRSRQVSRQAVSPWQITNSRGTWTLFPWGQGASTLSRSPTASSARCNLIAQSFLMGKITNSIWIQTDDWHDSILDFIEQVEEAQVPEEDNKLQHVLVKIPVSCFASPSQ